MTGLPDTGGRSVQRAAVGRTPRKDRPLPDQEITAEVVGDRIQIIDHRQCKGCDCPPLLELTRKETTQLRLQVYRALNELKERHLEQLRQGDVSAHEGK